ncbi:VOC family protein [soil metagenome]
MEPRLSLVTLGVSDLARARTFYEHGLGWPVQPQSTGDVVFFGLQGLWLALWSREALAEDAGLSPGGSGFSGIALAHNVRTRQEVDAVLAQAEGAGARIVRGAQEVFWGGYTGYFTDPDGHLWEVAHNPHFWTGR